MTRLQDVDPFVGEGEVPALCRDVDWADTALGPVDGWSRALRGAVRMCLESPFPINLWCGEEYVLIYNDAYTAVLGSKHPRALGRPGPEVWAEIWDGIQPMFERIRAGGPPVYAEDAPFIIRRDDDDSGAVTAPNAWFTFALSPVRDERGEIVAMLNIVSESTQRILLERDIRSARAKAERAETRLREVFTQAPAFMAVLRGEQHVFEYVNSSYYQLTGHRDLIGRPALEALPEIRDQGFVELLDEVVATGIPYVGREISVLLSRTPGSEPEQRFLDFVYYPITEADGTRTGVVAHGSDVTDHVRSRREAQRARQEAEEASRAKSQFLANMSHEIRTPINAIIGYTDLLALGITGPVTDEQRTQLERVRASSRHLLTIVDDVLDVARVEAGRMEVERDRVLVATTVTASLALVRPQATERQIDLIDDCQPHSDIAYAGDDARVRQILVNLLSNAVKFTAPGGEVRIACGVVEEVPRNVDIAFSGPLTWMRVSDTGVGIPPDEIHAIFQPFTQLDDGTTRKGGGTGLGLTISRHLARLMGGDLTVESEPGTGSRFTLWLPSEVVGLDEAAVEATREKPPANLAAVGHALQRALPDVLDRFMDMLRQDPGMPQSAELGAADLEDHASTFLIDIAQSMIALEESQAVPDRLLQDGSEIQRVVAELHGRQRAQLGWTDDALRREWSILWRLIESAIRSDVPHDDIDDALALLRRFIDRGERISARSRTNLAKG